MFLNDVDFATPAPKVMVGETEVFCYRTSLGKLVISAYHPRVWQGEEKGFVPSLEECREKEEFAKRIGGEKAKKAFLKREAEIKKAWDSLPGPLREFISREHSFYIWDIHLDKQGNGEFKTGDWNVVGYELRGKIIGGRPEVTFHKDWARGI